MSLLRPEDVKRMESLLSEWSPNPIAYANADMEFGEAAPVWLEKAERELRETPERRRKAVAELRELVLGDETLTCRTDDEYLIRFLRPCKFYVNSAFEKMQGFHRHVEKHYKLYTEINIEAVAKVIMDFVVVSLPYRDSQGRRLLYIKSGAWNPDKVSLDDGYTTTALLTEMGINEPTTQINGVVLIWDIEGIFLKQLFYLTPNNVKRAVEGFLVHFPARMKEIHIVHQSTLFKVGFNIIKPFLPHKLRNRIHLHGSNLKSLYQFIPQEYLPQDIGGTLPHRDARRLVQVVCKHMDMYEETLRPLMKKKKVGSSNNEDEDSQQTPLV